MLNALFNVPNPVKEKEKIKQELAHFEKSRRLEIDRDCLTYKENKYEDAHDDIHQMVSEMMERKQTYQAEVNDLDKQIEKKKDKVRCLEHDLDDTEGKIRWKQGELEAFEDHLDKREGALDERELELGDVAEARAQKLVDAALEGAKRYENQATASLSAKHTELLAMIEALKDFGPAFVSANAIGTDASCNDSL